MMVNTSRSIALVLLKWDSPTGQLPPLVHGMRLYKNEDEDNVTGLNC